MKYLIFMLKITLIQILYIIDNCYKLYYANLYNELSKNYKLTTQGYFNV